MQQIVEHVRLLGCTCDPPDIRFTGPPRYGETTHVHVGHDTGCPLAEDGLKSAIVIPDPEDAS